MEPRRRPSDRNEEDAGRGGAVAGRRVRDVERVLPAGARGVDRGGDLAPKDPNAQP